MAMLKNKTTPTEANRHLPCEVECFVDSPIHPDLLPTWILCSITTTMSLLWSRTEHIFTNSERDVLIDHGRPSVPSTDEEASKC